MRRSPCLMGQPVQRGIADPSADRPLLAASAWPSTPGRPTAARQRSGHRVRPSSGKARGATSAGTQMADLRRTGQVGHKPAVHQEKRRRRQALGGAGGLRRSRLRAWSHGSPYYGSNTSNRMREGRLDGLLNRGGPQNQIRPTVRQQLRSAHGHTCAGSSMKAWSEARSAPADAEQFFRRLGLEPETSSAAGSWPSQAGVVG